MSIPFLSMSADMSVYRWLFFLLIIIIGVFTSVTDLCHKKIRNNHLIIITVAAVILTVIKGLSDKSSFVLQLLSTACAIIMAWVFYKNNSWRGGDAKLFVLLSFLMPVTGYESRIFFPSLALFANAFIIALIFLGFLLLKDFCIHPKIIMEGIFKNFDLGSYQRCVIGTLHFVDYFSFITRVWIVQIWCFVFHVYLHDRHVCA